MTTSQEQIIQNSSIGQGQSTLRDLIPTCKQAALNKISGFAKGAHEFGREKWSGDKGQIGSEKMEMSLIKMKCVYEIIK